MIVETMTYEELCLEYDRIHKEFYPRVERRLSDGADDYKQIRRYMIQHKTQQNVLGKPLTFGNDILVGCEIPIKN